MRNALKQHGISSEGELDQLVEKKDVQSFIKKELISSGKASGLQGAEVVSDVIIGGEVWTPEGGQLTAANKINRKGIVEQYKDQIDVSLGL